MFAPKLPAGPARRKLFCNRYPVSMQYAPEPTDDQLAALANSYSAGSAATFDRRILGGLGCTMDVLRVRERSGAQSKVLLRRRGMWSRDDNLDAARAELEVLHILRRNDIPVPEPLWADENGIFSEPATMIEFIDGAPLMNPDDPVEYATQLAQMLARLHDVSPEPEIRSQLRDYNAQEKKDLAQVEPPEYVAGHHLGAQLWAAMRAELDERTLDTGVFLHGDYWPGNTLWQGQKLIAVVDFEEIGMGDPALDVATAVVNFRFEPWRDAADHFLAVYRSETGRKLESLRFWSLKELRRPMPDIERWLPSFKEISSNPDITANELRAKHDGLIREVLGRSPGDLDLL